MSTTTQKRRYANAMDDAEAFKALFPPSSYKQWEFGGSLRRQRPEVADIEHVIIPCFGEVSGDGLFGETKTVNLVWFTLDGLTQLGAVSKHVYGTTGFRWGEKYRGVDYRGFNNELFMADGENWGSVLAIRTGPWEFSKLMVTTMQRNGYQNRDGYVWRHGTQDRIPAPDEKTFFALCGMKWVDPRDRA